MQNSSLDSINPRFFRGFNSYIIFFFLKSYVYVFGGWPNRSRYGTLVHTGYPFVGGGDTFWSDTFWGDTCCWSCGLHGLSTEIGVSFWGYDAFCLRFLTDCDIKDIILPVQVYYLLCRKTTGLLYTNC